MKLRLAATAATVPIFLFLGSLTQAHGADAGPIRHVALPAICSKTFNPYKQPISVLRLCGDRIEWLRHVTPLPGGGKSYSYGEYTTLVPPAHFKVLKASDKQLSEYGFPTRKQLGSQWYKLMRHVRSFAQPTPYLVEDPGIHTSSTASAGKDKVAPSITDSYNWTGYDVHNHSYTQVTATWTEPRFAAGCSNDMFFQWVGLGGVNTSTIGQDGTQFNWPGFDPHQGFIQTNAGNSGGPVAVNIVAGPGDSYYASTLWDPTLREFFYYMQDNTTGASSSNNSRVIGAADQSTAEVISERPIIGYHANGTPIYSQLADFQVVAVQQTRAYWDGSSSGFYYDSANPFNMYDTYNSLLAYPTLMATDSSFYTCWNQCV